MSRIRLKLRLRSEGVEMSLTKKEKTEARTLNPIDFPKTEKLALELDELYNQFKKKFEELAETFSDELRDKFKNHQIKKN